MNAIAAPPPTSMGEPIGPDQRLGATLALSMVLFGVLILGVGFSQEDAAPVVPTLDVILTEVQTPDRPDQADFIAQANNQGGGDQDRVQRPRESLVSPVPKADEGVAPEPMTAQAPRAQREDPMRLLTTTARTDTPSPPPQDRPRVDPSTLPSGRELVQQSMEMARLAAEIERQSQLYAKRPRRKFVSASTQEYEYAAYLRAWVAKVERVGNLNYPDEARRRGLSGRLVMTVAVRRDGTVEDTTLVQPSGESSLDEAALRIVRLAEPFPPLPNTDENIDILHITRTWEFSQGSVSTE